MVCKSSISEAWRGYMRAASLRVQYRVVEMCSLTSCDDQSRTVLIDLGVPGLSFLF